MGQLRRFHLILAVVCSLFDGFTCQNAWPSRVIPFTIDYSISKDPQQFYALLSGKTLLERDTCVRFVPRSNEQSYVKFADLGGQAPCWDFLVGTEGVVPVNVGPACMRPSVSPKHIFSECDLELINSVYECDEYPQNGRENDCTVSKMVNFHRYSRMASPQKRPRNSSSKKDPWQEFYRTSTASPPPRRPKHPKPSPRPFKASTRTAAAAAGKKMIAAAGEESKVSAARGKCSSACHYDGALAPFYQSFNNDLLVMNHFYTEDKIELSTMMTQNYLKEDSLGYIGQNPFDKACNCLKPLYRLYSDLYHDTLLTAELEEKERASAVLGYKFERIIGYCTSEPGCGAYLPLYRLFNFMIKDHMYTTSQDAMQFHRTHPSTGYGLERIECFIWQYNVSSRGCEE